MRTAKSLWKGLALAEFAMSTRPRRLHTDTSAVATNVLELLRLRYGGGKRLDAAAPL